MGGVIRIAQITDCHVSGEPGTLYRGQDPRTRLQAVLNHVIERKPDLLLATGDLSEDGSADSYMTLKEMFSQPGVPVLALPGNHDDPDLLVEHFPGTPVNNVQVTDHGDWRIVRLNSCVPGAPHGFFDAKTLRDLEQTLAAAGRPCLVALHHQPLLTNSPWIDKYRLVEGKPFLRLVAHHPEIKAVVWGHIHQVFETEINGTLMLGGPSSVANSLPDAESFTHDGNGGAYRWLELGSDGVVKTGVDTTVNV